MAKKKLLTYREWQQKEAQRKAKAAATRAAAKEAKMAAWWAMPAQRNYVELDAGWVDHGDGPVQCRHSGAVHADGDMMIHARVMPDKRRHGRTVSKVGIHLTVEAGTTKEEVTQRLLALATAVFASDNLWETANGPALERPLRFEGQPPNLRRHEPFPSPAAVRPSPATPTAPTAASTPPTEPLPTDLLHLRDRMHRWLNAHRMDESPLALLTVEQLAEVLLMRVCGNDIVLVSDQDPWRWDHTAEELRAAEETLAGELETLSSLVTALNLDYGPSMAIEALLKVFVQGRFS